MRKEFDIRVKVIAHSDMNIAQVIQEIMKGEQAANDSSAVRFHFEFPRDLAKLLEIHGVMES
jgi:hypothetical protein